MSASAFFTLNEGLPPQIAVADVNGMSFAEAMTDLPAGTLSVPDDTHPRPLTGTLHEIEVTPLDTSLGADQIRLTLNHAVANSTEVFASWEYLTAGSVVGSGSFAKPGNIFDGETWTRVDFSVSAPIPEPETYAMMLLGLGLIGWRLRRR